jgi:hypothetical protein
MTVIPRETRHEKRQTQEKRDLFRQKKKNSASKRKEKIQTLLKA